MGTRSIGCDRLDARPVELDLEIVLDTVCACFPFLGRVLPVFACARFLAYLPLWLALPISALVSSWSVFPRALILRLAWVAVTLANPQPHVECPPRLYKRGGFQ